MSTVTQLHNNTTKTKVTQQCLNKKQQHNTCYYKTKDTKQLHNNFTATEKLQENFTTKQF